MIENFKYNGYLTDIDKNSTNPFITIFFEK